MKLGIFGGTFDPPHIAHLILAAEAREQLDLDRLLWVLTPSPPHKPDRQITPLIYRYDLLQAALSGNTNFEISRVEMDRSPPHYSVDTVALLRELNPEATLYYLMGGDSLHDLPTWYRPDEFVKQTDFLGVMRRPGDQIDLDRLEKALPGIREKICFVEAPLLEISGSAIRRKVAEGRGFRYYVPEPVYWMIQERHLYRSNGL